MAVMPSYQTQLPGTWHHMKWKGNTIYFNDYIGSATHRTIRTVNSYAGPRPSLSSQRVYHDFLLNQQSIDLVHSAAYNYLDGSTEIAEGPGLYPYISGATLLPAYDWTALESQALSKMTEKVRGDLDVSVDLAEAGKTLKMLKVTDRVVEYTHTFKRRFGLLKLPANLWLEYTYGLKPLLSTIFGCADENLRVVINKMESVKARAKGIYCPQYVSVTPVTSSTPYSFKTTDPVKVSVTYGFDMHTDQHDQARWSTLNPLGITWELLPYSFVVDWFLNVGGYLRNYETFLLYYNKFRSGYRTRFSTGKLQFGLLDIGVNPGETGHISSWKGTLWHINIDRKVLTEYPEPSLPSFDAKLGSSRLLSAASLLAGFLGR